MKKLFLYIRFLFAWAFVLAIVGVVLVIYHLKVKPIGYLSEWIPVPAPALVAEDQQKQIAVNLQEVQEVQVDPGEKIYQVAQELLAEGKRKEAKDKFISIFQGFPESSCAASAIQIAGEMNMDELLSVEDMTGKETYKVVKGDVLVAIASKHQTTLESMMHMNSLFEFKSIQPGNEFIIMPLNYRFVVDLKRLTLSVWDQARFIKQYYILGIPSAAQVNPEGKIASKAADWEGKRITAQMKYYGGAPKSIQLSKPNVWIRGWDGKDPKPTDAILLKSEDMEELNLLTRVGNDVEIR